MLTILTRHRPLPFPFLLRPGHAGPLYIGKVHRTVPLADRAIPFRNFALPFNLAPHDSAALLLYSARATGIHEMSIRLSTEKHFTIKANDEETAMLFAISSAFFFLFSVCALGLIFKHRLLIHFGIYMISIVLGLLNFAYFFDAFSFPSFLGLNANSIGIFLIFTVNSMLHIFGVTYLRSTGLYVRWHRYMVTLLVTANAVQMVVLLFPLSQVTNSFITEASLVLTTFNILWLFYISVLGFIRKQDKYLLITALLIFIPILYKSYVSTTPALNYDYMQPIYYLLLFGYLTVSLFRKELTSRQITEEKIKMIQDELERLRKSEIEQIGRNLHDQLGNTLASALGYLSMQIPNVPVSKKMILDAINQTRVTIQAFLTDGIIHISIEDDGIGSAGMQQTNGIGLQNMFKRAELANLNLAIDKGINGTSVNIETPLMH